jgi:hypothetical protein
MRIQIRKLTVGHPAHGCAIGDDALFETLRASRVADAPNYFVRMIGL